MDKISQPQKTSQTSASVANMVSTRSNVAIAAIGIGTIVLLGVVFGHQGAQAFNLSKLSEGIAGTFAAAGATALIVNKVVIPYFFPVNLLTDHKDFKTKICDYMREILAKHPPENITADDITTFIEDVSTISKSSDEISLGNTKVLSKYLQNSPVMKKYMDSFDKHGRANRKMKRESCDSLAKAQIAHQEIADSETFASPTMHSDASPLNKWDIGL